MFNKDYEKIFFISKSIGNVISFGVDKKLTNKKVEYICYTPISQNIQDISTKKCIVFCGTKDKLFTADDRNMIMNNENIKLVQIENAVHSLEVDDSYEQSIDILRRITDQCVEYIKERMIV